MTTPLLQKFQQRARDAHAWTSFSPEKRGDQMIAEYSEQLQADLDELKAGGASDESITDYQNRYEQYFSSYIAAKSRCASPMITGPSNFPTRRAEKANRSEEKHYTVFMEWRKRAKKAIIRKAQPAKTFVSELERYRDELASCQRNHELMKEGNKIIKQANKEGKDISEYLIKTFDIAPHMVSWTMQFGFGLQNNNANMKRIEERIKILEAKEARRNNNPETDYAFTGGTVTVNYEADRVQIKHDTKPSPEVITNLKRNGFKWSPSNKAWQRKITNEAIYKTNQLTGLNIPRS